MKVDKELQEWCMQQAKWELVNGCDPKTVWIGKLLGSMKDWLLAAVNARGAKVTRWVNEPFADDFYTEVNFTLQGRPFAIVMRPLFEPEKKRWPIKRGKVAARPRK
jgi:hypothetical protein